MSRTIVQNFRGRRALLVLAEDDNRAALAASLVRLGLEVALALPGEDLSAALPCDIVFFDADEGQEPVFGNGEAPDVPFVPVIGLETPGRLTRVVRQRASAHIMKPVRAAGVFTALFLAFNEHVRRRAEADEKDQLARRLAGRRDLLKAVLVIMNARGVDDDEAFWLLRRESMRRRIAIEDLAREVLVTGGAAAGAPVGAPHRAKTDTTRKKGAS